jgi:hypothetical protein
MKLLLRILLPAFLITVSPAFALDAINTNLFGVAVKGYDVVAYHTESKPVEGSSDFTLKWQEATWRFSTEANRDAFAKEPERYAPQFGGYCAWAVSQGYTAGIDPEAWRIVDGKLYLNYSPKVQKTWEKDVTENISNAETNWPKLLSKE